jgi:hypothetical protein
MLDHSVAAQQGQERGKEYATASALKVLLDEVLPVLVHAASHKCQAIGAVQHAHDALIQHVLFQPSTAQPGAALTTDPPAASGGGLTNSVPLANVHTLQLESTLLLLGASANLLNHRVPLAVTNKDA